MDLVTAINAAMTSRMSGLFASDATRKIWNPWDNTTPSYGWNASALTRIAPAVNMTHTAAWGSWLTMNGGAVISPRFVSVAAHVSSNPIGQTMRFVAPDGTPVTRTIDAFQQVAGADLMIVRLSTALPSTITPAKRMPANWVNYVPRSYAPAWAPVLHYLPLFENRLIALYADRDRILNVAYMSQIDGFVQIDECPAYTQFCSPIIDGTSGNDMLVIMPDGTPVVLAVVLSTSGGPSQAEYLAQGNAAIASLGGAVNEYFSTVDLSAYDTYAAPAIPDYTTGQVTIPYTYGGAGVVTKIKLYADGTGDFATCAALLDPASAFYATVGDVVIEYQGSADQLGAFSYDSTVTAGVFSRLFIQPKSGGEAGPKIIGTEHSLGALTLKFSADSTLTEAVVSGTVIGKIIVTLGSAGGSCTKCTFSNFRHRIIAALTGGTQYASNLSFGSDGSADLFPRTFVLSNVFDGSEVTHTATNVNAYGISNTGFAGVVQIYQTDIDATKVKGTGKALLFSFANDYSCATTLDMRNSVAVGTATTIGTSGSGGTLIYDGNCGGNFTYDANANLGTTSGKTPASMWSGYATWDYTLTPGSPAIGNSTTSPVPLDIGGVARPRMLNGSPLVDAGPSTFVVGTVLGLTVTRTGAHWTAYTGATGYQISIGGGAFSATGISGTTYTGTILPGQSVVVWALDSGSNVLAQGLKNFSPNMCAMAQFDFAMN